MFCLYFMHDSIINYILRLGHDLNHDQTSRYRVKMAHMQKIDLTSIEPNQALNILKTRLESLDEGETLTIVDSISRDGILEKLRHDYFETLRWYGFMETDQHWVAEVKKMSSENCCGGCCKGE